MSTVSPSNSYGSYGSAFRFTKEKGVKIRKQRNVNQADQDKGSDKADSDEGNGDANGNSSNTIALFDDDDEDGDDIMMSSEREYKNAGGEETLSDFK